jgi:hypothetical protein
LILNTHHYAVVEKQEKKKIPTLIEIILAIGYRSNLEKHQVGDLTGILKVD